MRLKITIIVSALLISSLEAMRQDELKKKAIECLVCRDQIKKKEDRVTCRGRVAHDYHRDCLERYFETNPELTPTCFLCQNNFGGAPIDMFRREAIRREFFVPQEGGAIWWAYQGLVSCTLCAQGLIDLAMVFLGFFAMGTCSFLCVRPPSDSARYLMAAMFLGGGAMGLLSLLVVFAAHGPHRIENGRIRHMLEVIKLGTVLFNVGLYYIIIERFRYL